MIWWIAVPLLAVLSILQTSLFRQVFLLDGNLDLLLVTVLCWSLLRPEESLAWAVAAGCFADLFTGGPFGVTSIAFLFSAFCIGQLHGRLRTHSPVVVMAIAIFGTLLAHLASIALLTLSGRGLDIGYLLMYVTLPAAFLNTLFSVPVYLALRRLHVIGAPALTEEGE
ncbi:MAG: rod shape-determining protein MreD [Anaerolineales bacterium]|nr:rod shape-determining protein MreD [Anaerolineales bacterium]